MPLITWGEHYSVDIKELDDQHKKLIALVNSLDDAMRQGKARQALGKILDELVSYTKTHFAAEERILKTHGYPEYEEHKSKHDKMAQKVLDIQSEYQRGEMNLTFEVMKFLQNWLDLHIKGTDMKYSPFLKSKGFT